jgi:hypothetical protein
VDDGIVHPGEATRRTGRAGRWPAKAAGPSLRAVQRIWATMTHDHARHGTTTLSAALDALDGTVIGRCLQRHRHRAFIRFLGAVEAIVPAGKLVRAILDDHAARKHPTCGLGRRGTCAGRSTARRPRRARSSAAASPTGPAPTTTTSCSTGRGDSASGVGR